MKKMSLLLLSASVLLLGACGNTKTTTDDKLHIVTTFYPMYEFTKQVVGDEATVDLLVQAGTEVHDYEPSAKDMARIQDADVFIYENENMETWVHDIEASIDETKVHVIRATEGLLLLPGEEEGHDTDEHDTAEHHHAYDPHVWLSPERAITLVQTIRDSLTQSYPDQKAVFEKNAAAYIAQLEKLHNQYKESLSAAKQKYFVTQHTAFAYLALDYGLKQVSITGVSADEDPTPSRLASLTDYINKYGINYIYFEENASKSVAETLAKETGVQLDVLNPLESLTEEEMKNGENYISVMEENLAALEKTTSKEGKVIPSEEEVDVHHKDFEESDVKDRPLSDYAGRWQSVYPHLLQGNLDQVFDYQAKIAGEKTAAAYKSYYENMYKTDIDYLTIGENTIEFISGEKREAFSYTYSGYKIVNLKNGEKEVRYLFEATDENAGKYKYVQLSDHHIAPEKTEHFHIFIGRDSQEALLKEERRPLYYSEDLIGLEIAQELLAH